MELSGSKTSEFSPLAEEENSHLNDPNVLPIATLLKVKCDDATLQTYLDKFSADPNARELTVKFWRQIHLPDEGRQLIHQSVDYNKINEHLNFRLMSKYDLDDVVVNQVEAFLNFYEKRNEVIAIFIEGGVDLPSKQDRETEYKARMEEVFKDLPRPFDPNNMNDNQKLAIADFGAAMVYGCLYPDKCEILPTTFKAVEVQAISSGDQQKWGQSRQREQLVLARIRDWSNKFESNESIPPVFLVFGAAHEFEPTAEQRIKIQKLNALGEEQIGMQPMETIGETTTAQVPPPFSSTVDEGEYEFGDSVAINDSEPCIEEGDKIDYEFGDCVVINESDEDSEDARGSFDFAQRAAGENSDDEDDAEESEDEPTNKNKE